ncbi:MAG: ABC transporter ATP-binding protein [Caldimicrobium sp.]|nr:ABC transporter ATP-binding protein [Caldimicrobium sp.]MDW8094470.1 ABC transporter ATP-binding protein [Caldimicrobium sp.]
MKEIAISISNLKKSYGKVIALKGISFDVYKGEIFALLGPNGAGKTTTLRILSGLTKPTSGEIFILGENLKERELFVKTQIGLVPQHVNLDLELTVEENLIIHGLLFKLSYSEIKRRITELLELASLTDRRKTRVKELSGGLKRRLLIIRALLHSPKILLLDEPTAGLDPHIRRKLWSFIKQIQAQGTTILLTTHYMEEAEILANRVAFIFAGNIVAIDTPTNFIKSLGQVALDIFINGEMFTRYYPTREEAERALSEFNKNYTAVTLRKVSLEDVFMKYTSERLS